MNRSSLLFLISCVAAALAAGACSASGASGAGDDDGTGTGTTDGGGAEGGHNYGNDAGEGEGGDEEGGSSCGATTTIENCGECGNKCPGAAADGGAAAGANVTCGADGGASVCGFSCSGERYDVNGDAGDGCEISDNPFGNHAVLAATSVGSFSCNDGSSAQDITGKIVSDQRVHETPAIPGFVASAGAAPDYFSIDATGGTFCEDNISLTMQLTGTTHGECYTLTADCDKGSYTCTPSAGSTSCGFSQGSGSYGDDSTINVHVDKTCSSTTHESVSYEITGHL